MREPIFGSKIVVTVVTVYTDTRANLFENKTVLIKFCRYPERCAQMTKEGFPCQASYDGWITFEPVHEKINNLHRRKQRRRSASQ